MNKSLFLSIPLFIMALMGCQKEEFVAHGVHDPALEKYFGDWEFSYNTTTHSYVMVFDSLGNPGTEYQVTQNSSTKIGEVSMGRKLGELLIRFDKNDISDYYYATVLNEQGHLTCGGNCDNLGGGSLPPNGYHHIYETEYRVDLGYYSTGGYYSTTTTWDITGVPL